MPDLTLTLLQTALHWEDVPANLAALEEKIARIGQPTDLIILPEMFTTGFTMNAAALAEPMNLLTFKWLRQQAAATGAVVTGSYIVREGERYFNRLVWMRPDGTHATYDKRHLFRMANEQGTYAGGNQRLVVELKGWRICPLVCYDLRFPVWSRNVDNAYDLLVYVANWPRVRRHPWQSLLVARAIENLAYVVGVNRVGTDGNGHPYAGDSAVINFRGETLFTQPDTEVTHTTVLSHADLLDFREKFPAHLDADTFTLLP